ncbi:hypothetical protein, partial [Novacetimonas maltaceti]
RRLDAIAKTVNQIAKTQKLPAKHINQGFFDPSNSLEFPLTAHRYLTHAQYSDNVNPVALGGEVIMPIVRRTSPILNTKSSDIN